MINYYQKAKSIYENENSTQEDNFDIIKNTIESWNKKVFEFLKNSFEPENNEFAVSFYNSRKQRFRVDGRTRDFNTIRKELFEDLNEKIGTLAYYQRILSVSDAIIKPDEIDLEYRKKITTEEILDLILEKLYILYDNYYHSIETILTGNGIEIKRHGEERDYAKLLESYGYVNLMFTQGVSAQLTAEGKIYVENKLKISSTDYDKISSSESEIARKIDEIIERLTTLGDGQEILFEELEELKDLYGKIGKKNWGQLLKGKLIDLGLSQIVNMDVINSIYQELTEQILRLP